MKLLNLFHYYQRWLINTIPIRRYIQRADVVELPSQRFGLAQWVISRAVCRFRHFSLTHLPAEQRKAALQLQLMQWAPFPEAAYAIAWQPEGASVWAWDQAKTSALLAARGLKTRSVAYFPESSLRPIPESGIYLWQCLDGFEGQIIATQRIQHSRWWPSTPSEAEWISFLRDSQIPLEVLQENQVIPAAQNLSLAKHPTFSLETPETLQRRYPLWEQWLYWGALGVLGLLSVKELALWNQYQQQIQSIKSAIASKRLEAAPILRAREEALAAQAFIQELESFAPFPSQLELLAKVSERMPREGTAITEWMAQPGKLKITFAPPAASTGTSATFLVDALQKVEWFTNVRNVVNNSNSKNITLEMEVRPKKTASSAPGKAP